SFGAQCSRPACGSTIVVFHQPTAFSGGPFQADATKSFRTTAAPSGTSAEKHTSPATNSRSVAAQRREHRWISKSIMILGRPPAALTEQNRAANTKDYKTITQLHPLMSPGTTT